MIVNGDDDDEIEVDSIPELDGERVDHGADDVANSKGNAAPEVWNRDLFFFGPFSLMSELTLIFAEFAVFD